MVQNGPNVSHSYLGDPTRPSRVIFGTLAIGLAALACGAWTLAQTAAPSPAAAERARLLKLQREAVELVKAAAKAPSPDAARRALSDSAVRLDELGREPVAAAAPQAALLRPELRAELREAARALRAASDRPGRFDAAPSLAVLEKARAQLEGEIALGLDFQGSYSQSKPKEPVYGGHASAMGPAPAQVASADDVASEGPSAVELAEPTRLEARTYCGGPTKDHILESGGSGLALFDYDGDGRLDVYLVTAAELTKTRERVPHRNVLYRNLGGFRFEDVSRKAGVDAAAWGSGACAGDFDDDGRLDLYVTNWGPNLLYRNQGDGTFSEAAARAGVAAGGWSTGCSFFDADADGDLDLYVARYVETSWDDVLKAQRTLTWRDGPRIMIGPAGLPGEADLFFENLGQGRFEERAEAHGLADAARGYGFGVVSTDYDDDGAVDLFVANDSTPNFLYRNLGGGRFENVGLVSGVAVNTEARAQAGMGADAGDYDGDGLTDLVLTAFAHDTNTLYRNLDGRQFEDASTATGLRARTFERMGWGAAFLDADLDGWLDLFFANGHIFADVGDFPALGESFAQKSQLLLNRGGRFRDVSARAGAPLQVPKVSRGLAVGDLDDDGDPDLVLNNMDDTPTVLENRQQTGNRWVGFRVVSPTGNRFAIGAKVTIDAGGKKQFREIRSGGSYLSQSDLRPLFGLGDHAGPVDVEVRMPGGRRWRWQGLPAGRLHTLALTDDRKLSTRTP
ncbi:MAG TPA: CRTAC1 family protein [Vicinamibacteria bacterium]